MPTLITQWLAHPMAEALAIALVSFIWQGTAMALVVAVGLFLTRRAPANVRYAIACVGLAAMAVAPLVTTVGALGSTQTLVPRASLAAEAPAASPQVFVSYPNEAAARPQDVSYYVGLSRWRLSVLLVWMVGVAVLSVRLTHGWRHVVTLRRSTVPLDNGPVVAVLARLAARLGVRRRVALVESTLLDTPTVIGWIKPVVLFPVGALTGLSPYQLEAVLAHELAHIRRHDYAVNVLQHVVETLLFYHPAVWWVSNRIRVEREHSCDELAVNLCGDRIAYARTLASLEEARQRRVALGVAATDGDLVGRVRRLLSPTPASARPSAGFAMAVVAIALVSVVLVQGQSAQPAPVPSPAAVPLPAPAAMLPVDLELPTVVEVSMPIATVDTVPSLPVPSSGVGVVDALPTPDLSLPVLTPGRQSPVPGVPIGSTVRESIIIEATPLDVPPVVEATEIRPGPARVVNTAVPQRRVYVPPVYPEAARAEGIVGVVYLAATINSTGDVIDVVAGHPVLHATISASGTVSDVREVSAPAASLIDAAIEAVRQWKYSPALQDGIPVAVRLSVTINFVPPPRRTTGVLDPSAIDVVSSGPQGAVRIGGAISAPRQLKFVEPIMPAIARAARMSGIVFLEVTLSKTGRVVDTKVIRSAGVLDQAAIDAVQQWEYEPVLLNGQPVEVIMTVTVNFDSPTRTAGLRDPAATEAVLQGQRGTSPEPVRIGGAISAPRQLKFVEPIMPAIARAARMSGIVFLEVTLNRNGQVRDVKVTRSAGVLDQAAIDAVRQWEYEPVLLNGQPVEVIVTVTVSLSWK